MRSVSKSENVFQFANNDYGIVAHHLGSQVLDSIASSGQDAKKREKLPSIASSSNASNEQTKSAFPWLSKHDFHVKHKNEDKNEGIKKHHRSKVKKSSVEVMIIFCTRNDNAQDVANRAFNYVIDENISFAVPSWIRSMSR